MFKDTLIGIEQSIRHSFAIICPVPINQVYFIQKQTSQTLYALSTVKGTIVKMNIYRFLQLISSPRQLIWLTTGIISFFAFSLLQRESSNYYPVTLAAIMILFGYSMIFSLGIKVENFVNLKTTIPSIGRISRVLFSSLFTFTILYLMNESGISHQNSGMNIVSLLPLSLLLSYGIHSGETLALGLSGKKGRPFPLLFFLFLSINLALGSALLITNVNIITYGLTWFIGASIPLIYFVVASDMRRFMAPMGGIGIFLGTFNPFHKGHLALVLKAMEERNLSKVYIHSTVIPALHRMALNKGEIVIAKKENGLRVYEKTAKADPLIDYFPTGNKFYEYKYRHNMIKEALNELNLTDKIVLLSMEDVYATNGFYGIINKIKELHPKTRIHGIHGSDSGAMWIRRIYNESGSIYPYVVRRAGKISATAIRNGEKGMTFTSIEKILNNLQNV